MKSIDTDMQQQVPKSSHTSNEGSGFEPVITNNGPTSTAATQNQTATSSSSLTSKSPVAQAPPSTATTTVSAPPVANITQRTNFRVIIIGSFILAVNAGFIGAMYISGLHNAGITNVTGDIAKTGALISQARNIFIVARMSLVWLAYIAGSSVSAMIVSGTKQFELRRTFGWALLLESMLLFLSYHFVRTPEQDMLEHGWYWAEYFGAMACGLQNALCTSYSGAVIRTTHLTGVSTDIGIALGQEVRIRFILPIRTRLGIWRRSRKAAISSYSQRYKIISEHVDSDAQNGDGGGAPSQQVPPPLNTNNEVSLLWRLKVLVPLLFGYLFGAIAGAVSFTYLGGRSMLAPATFILLLGISYVIYTTRNRLSKTRQRIQAVANDFILMSVLKSTRTDINIGGGGNNNNNIDNSKSENCNINTDRPSNLTEITAPQ